MLRRTLVSTWVMLFLVVHAVETHASPPSASASTIPAGIRLVGLGAGGAADPAGAFSVTMRFQNGHPYPGSTVMVVFTDCTAADIRLGSVHPPPGLVLDCANNMVTAMSDAEGVARFAGAANNGGGSPPAAGGLCPRYTPMVSPWAP